MKAISAAKPYTNMTYALAALMLITAGAGLAGPSIYGDFTSPQRVAESQGQDVVTLIVAVPLLLFAVRVTQRSDVHGSLLWVGTLGYTLYVYLIYAYGGLYSFCFPLYVATLGLCLFSIIGLLNGLDADAIHRQLSPSGSPTLTSRRVIAGYLVGTAALLAVIWSGAIASAIATAVPADGTLIYVTDLAFVLPVFALAGIWYWQRRPWGTVLSGIMLVKAVTLGLSIVAGQLIAVNRGVGGEPFLAAFFGVFTLVGLATTVLYLRNTD